MSYVFEDLMKIKRYRLKTALNLLLHSKKDLDHAKISEEKLAKDLTDYINWRKNEEDRLFHEMKYMYKKTNHIDQFNQCIDTFNEKESVLKRRLKKAGNKVVQADDELKKAKIRYTKCHGENLKLEEHRAILRHEKMIEDNRTHDTMMDEISVINFNNQLRNS
jgi:hypothetical protein